MSKVLLHVSDWNYQDKYYRTTKDKLVEFAALVKSDGVKKAWSWWTEQVTYGGRCTKEKPVKFVTLVDTTLEEYFFDYENPLECVKEWAEQWQEEAEAEQA